MPKDLDHMTITYTGLENARGVAEKLARLANDGPIGFEKAARQIKALASTPAGMRLLREASRVGKNNLRLFKSRSGHHYSLDPATGMITFGDGTRGKRLPSGKSLSLLASYFYGAENKK